MAVFSARTFPPNGLWDFATRLYAKDRVEQVCLELQDRRGADVNVLLFCCWVAASGRGAFRAGELEAALAATQTWREDVTQPLRRLRRHLKGDVGAAPRRLSDDLRRVIAECELHAEHVEQLMLHDSLERAGTGTMDPAEQARAATQNLAAYFSQLEIDPDPSDRVAIAEILGCAFPTVAGWLITELSGT